MEVSVHPINGEDASSSGNGGDGVVPNIATTEEVCIYIMFFVNNNVYILFLVVSMDILQLLSWFDEMDCEISRNQDQTYT